jgi:ketosteroid isomerase-like protein
MTKTLFVLALGLILSVSAWAIASFEQSVADDAKKQLMDADRAFAKVTASKGLDGWMSVMADDAVRISPLGGKVVSGKAGVRELDAAIFADPKKQLVWEPTDGGAFADGKHGFTTGTSKFIEKTADGKETILSTGHYVTWWRKDDNGVWKVILDTGVSEPKK